MKKLISIMISIFICVLCAVPAFAAEAANFNITQVSETADTFVVSIDYDGGASFGCIDLTVSVNADKLTITKTETGSGLKNFRSDAEDAGGAVIATSNIKNGDVIAAVATTADYKNVNGKDMFIITMKKVSGDSISSSDVRIMITNCQTVNFADVPTSVTSSLSGAGIDTKPEEDNTETSTSVDSSSSQSVSDDSQLTTGEYDMTVGTDGSSIDVESIKDKQTDNDNTKKIVIIAICAIVMLIIVVGIIIYIVQITKKNDAKKKTEQDQDQNYLK